MYPLHFSAAEKVVPPPLAFNVVFLGVLVSGAEKIISNEVLKYTGGLQMHHIGSWCPGRYSIWPLLFSHPLSRGRHTRLRN